MAGKKFHFSLDSVLKLRRHEADLARRHLAQAIKRRHEQENRLSSVEKCLREVNETAAVATPTAPLSFQRLSTYRLDLQRARDTESQSLDQMRLDEMQARERLIGKRRQEETLQSLHDVERNSHQEEQNATETDFLDEQALIGFQRKRRLHH